MPVSLIKSAQIQSEIFAIIEKLGFDKDGVVRLEVEPGEVVVYRYSLPLRVHRCPPILRCSQDGSIEEMKPQRIRWR
jgi:hypothetical protein